jgi:hypothetical protein
VLRPAIHPHAHRDESALGLSLAEFLRVAAKRATDCSLDIRQRNVPNVVKLFLSPPLLSISGMAAERAKNLLVPDLVLPISHQHFKLSQTFWCGALTVKVVVIVC